MKDIFDILEQLKADSGNDIPPIVLSKGLPEVEEFQIGESRDDKKISFLIYQGLIDESDSEEKFNAIFQLQLPGVTIEQVAKYQDAVREWIKGYDSNRIGFTMYSRILTDTWPNDDNGTSFAIFEVFYEEELDSCSEG